MAIQIDFVVAVGLFFMVFVVVLGAASSHFSIPLDDMKMDKMRTDAMFLMDMLASKHGELSIMTKAYEMDIDAVGKVNTNNELVIFDMSGYGNIDYNSVMVYEPFTSACIIPSGGTTKTVAVSLEANKKKTFYVYFDDDSNFLPHSATHAGVDNVTETVWPAHAVDIVQFSKMIQLKARNYVQIKDSYRLEDFRITLDDVLKYGPDVPEESDVVSIQKTVIYQNSDGTIASGRIVVYVW